MKDKINHRLIKASVRNAPPGMPKKQYLYAFENIEKMRAHQELYMHILSTAPEVEQEQRARIYRALADIIGDESFARRLHERADAAEAALCADIQLALDYKNALGRT